MNYFFCPKIFVLINQSDLYSLISKEIRLSIRALNRYIYVMNILFKYIDRDNISKQFLLLAYFFSIVFLKVKFPLKKTFLCKYIILLFYYCYYYYFFNLFE